MMLTIIVSVVFLLNGCFPDLETQMRDREKAEVEVEIASTKLDIAKAKRDDTVAENKRLSDLKLRLSDLELNRINNKIESEKIAHEMMQRVNQSDAELQILASESGIRLSKGAELKNVNYEGADSLINNLKWNLFWGKNPWWGKFKDPEVKFSKKSPILVASFVDLDNLSECSAFGRVVSEQFASRFNQKGYVTVEIKLGSNLFIREGSGEFMLSREMKEISIKHRAEAALVGTYTVASERVYFTARIINVTDGRVLASHDYSVPISLDVFKLLIKGKEKAKPGWL
jgi:TolB-like protein